MHGIVILQNVFRAVEGKIFLYGLYVEAREMGGDRIITKIGIGDVPEIVII